MLLHIAQLQDRFVRDDAILAHHPACPTCGEIMQVQIVSKAVPAEWKCRMCKTSFFSEPATNGGVAMDEMKVWSGDHSARWPDGLSPEDTVEIECADGTREQGRSDNFDWRANGCPWNIIKYRVIKI